MSIQITQELEATPDHGPLPLHTTLAYRARSTSGAQAVDVTYSIEEPTGRTLRVAFKTPQGPRKSVVREGVTLDGFSRARRQTVDLIKDIGDTDPGTIVIVARMRRPGQPNGPVLKSTPCNVTVA